MEKKDVRDCCIGMVLAGVGEPESSVHGLRRCWRAARRSLERVVDAICDSARRARPPRKSPPYLLSNSFLRSSVVFMKFAAYIGHLSAALESQDAPQLLVLLQSSGLEHARLLKGTYKSSVCASFLPLRCPSSVLGQRASLQGFKDSIPAPWDEIAIAHVQVISKAADKDYVTAYKEQSLLVRSVRISYFSAWC